MPTSLVMRPHRLLWLRAVVGCQSWTRASCHMVSKLVTVKPTLEGA